MVMSVAGGGVGTETGATCVTVTVRLIFPPTTVMVPLRSLVPVLAVALIRNEPLPVRLAGLTLEVVNQFASLLTFHWMFDVTLIVVLLAVAGAFHEVGDIVS